MKWPESIRVMRLKKRKGVYPARSPSELAILDPSDEQQSDEEERVYVLAPLRKRKKSNP